MGFVASDASILAFMSFSIGVIVLGLFFAGIHVMPDPEKSVVSVSNGCKMAGTGELIGSVILLLGSPLGPGASVFIGSLTGVFGVGFWVIGLSLEKGDSRPLGTVTLFLAVVFGIYAVLAARVPGMKELSFLCWLGFAAAVASWIGAWNWSKIVGKAGGWMWVVLGIWGIKFFAVSLSGACNVMLGG
jgi:hypothetical protein